VDRNREAESQRSALYLIDTELETRGPWAAVGVAGDERAGPHFSWIPSYGLSATAAMVRSSFHNRQRFERQWTLPPFLSSSLHSEGELVFGSGWVNDRLWDFGMDSDGLHPSHVRSEHRRDHNNSIVWPIIVLDDGDQNPIPEERTVRERQRQRTVRDRTSRERDRQ
jgi:hypothetical protein